MKREPTVTAEAGRKASTTPAAAVSAPSRTALDDAAPSTQRHLQPSTNRPRKRFRGRRLPPENEEVHVISSDDEVVTIDSSSDD